jgi:hypothetical protein
VLPEPLSDQTSGVQEEACVMLDASVGSCYASTTLFLWSAPLAGAAIRQGT